MAGVASMNGALSNAAATGSSSSCSWETDRTGDDLADVPDPSTPTETSPPVECLHARRPERLQSGAEIVGRRQAALLPDADPRLFDDPQTSTHRGFVEEMGDERGDDVDDVRLVLPREPQDDDPRPPRF